MGQSELLMTLGAIVTFSLLTLSINRSVIAQSEGIYNQQIELYTMGIAQRFIEEAKTKAFDESAINSVSDPSNFTPTPASHGPEIYPYFDDVDDFVDAPGTITTPLGSMSVTIAIDYVNDTDLNTSAGTNTYYKKMTVTIQNRYLNRPVVADYVFAYQKN
jgi:hypothetical protein